MFYNNFNTENIFREKLFRIGGLMFVGRKKELQHLSFELSDWKKRSAILIYGKRRVGKSTLIGEAAKNFDGIVFNHLCVSSSFEGNLELICRSVCDGLSLPYMKFESLFALMDFLKTLDQRILLIIDEYPYLKQAKKKNEVDSYMQVVIDRLPQNVKLILCGSYITVMKELLTEDNPLFGRFSLIQHIHDFDYHEASEFYPNLSVRDKISFYAVFGGCPYVLKNLNYSKSLRENIEEFLLPETGLIRSHIENVILREIQKSFDIRVLETIGNGKKKYSEIRDGIGGVETGLLDKQLKILLDMETIQKLAPINRKNDKKKQFYEIVDNLMRFYFSYLFSRTGVISRIGEIQFYDKYIQTSLTQFVSRRFEDITLQYFHRMAILGKYPNVEDFGSYWYDDPTTKTNGEFDCVLKNSGGKYDFYECKYCDRPMTLEECREEKHQVEKIQGMQAARVGFVCTGGFAFEDEGEFILLSGENLYEA